MDKVFILIPALNPNKKLIYLIDELNKKNIYNIIIVNDGSSNEYNNIFEEARKRGCTILKNKINMGKGKSLKVGIKYLQNNIKELKGIVTADCDGQHTANDIAKVEEELIQYNQVILGCRNFKNKKIPIASKIGNKFSSLYFKIETGNELSDTQTGLRGIPSYLFNFALNINGNRYEYEMKFLEEMAEKNIKFRTIQIETIYEKDRSTHFNPIKDSYIIYKTFFRNIISSATSAILDVFLFMIFTKLIKVSSYIMISTIIARIISGLYNFIINKIWTFEKKNSGNTFAESIKYLILFITQMIVSGAVTSLLKIASNGHISLLIIKIIVDFIIFIINFIVQKRWVFKKREII
jgi:putative flippase GtrA